MIKNGFGLLERLKIKARQNLFRHKSNTPFISGDSISDACDYVIANRIDMKNFSKNSIEPKVIFCRSDLVSDLKDLEISFQEKPILVAGNSDFEFREVDILPHNLFRGFFLQNSFISDNKRIFTLPIGVENIKLGINGLPKNLKETIDWKNRSNRILVGPFSPTHIERETLLEKAKHDPENFELFSGKLSPSQYARLMNRYRYVACPRGNGIDTHRFWETIYRGAIPVVLSSEWSKSLRILEIPFIEVENWNDAPNSVSDYEKTDAPIPSLKIETLWVPYWKKRFRNL